jgi:hypothetical protein
MASPRDWLARALRHPSAALLLVQLAGVFLYPLMEDTPRRRALFGAFGALVLGAAIRMVRRSPAATSVALVLAVLVIALSIVHAITPQPSVLIAIASLNAAFYFYAAASLIAYMLQDFEITTDEFFAAGATFTLLAWAFAYLYVICQTMRPGSFGALIEPHADRTWMELLFLSFTTLSSVGLGDIVPLTAIARALVMLEELTGVMYIALVLSRLIALAPARRGRDAA